MRTVEIYHEVILTEVYCEDCEHSQVGLCMYITFTGWSCVQFNITFISILQIHYKWTNLRNRENKMLT